MARREHELVRGLHDACDFLAWREQTVKDRILAIDQRIAALQQRRARMERVLAAATGAAARVHQAVEVVTAVDIDDNGDEEEKDDRKGRKPAPAAAKDDTGDEKGAEDGEVRVDDGPDDREADVPARARKTAARGRPRFRS